MDVLLRERGVFAFGPFRLDPTRRTLRCDGHEVTLTARLFDTLLYLVQNPDRLVTRDELQGAVWGGRVVEDGNLQKAISALRKALQAEGSGDNIIVTVPGRGFRFAMPVSFEPEGVADTQLNSFGRTDDRSSSINAWRVRPGWGLAAFTTGAAAFVVVGSSVWYSADRPAALTPPPHSVAVLAFSNLSGDAGQEYFSDGLSEELIDALGRVGAVRVAARQSAFSFKGRSATIADIARQLNVGMVLEGSVRRDGTRLRVTAQLIDAQSGFQLWSHSYDRGQGDIFQIQGEIAEAVTTSLRVTLLGSDVAKLTLGGTTNPKAFDAHLHAIKLLESGEISGYRGAVAGFGDAILGDPSFAAAYAGRAWALSTLASFQTYSDPGDARKTYDAALASAGRAIALAPTWGEGYAARAEILEGGFLDFGAAQADAERALELAPGNVRVLMNYAWLQVLHGHSLVGITAAKQAAALDPLAPFTYTMLANVLYNARRYDESLAALNHAKALEGVASSRDQDTLAAVQLMKHDPKAAQQTCAGERDYIQSEGLAMAYHALGQTAKADAQFAKLRATMGEHGAFAYAEVLAQWGQQDEALRWLEIALRTRNADMELLRADPMLDPIRNTLAFRDIERRMNFPP